MGDRDKAAGVAAAVVEVTMVETVAETTLAWGLHQRKWRRRRSNVGGLLAAARAAGELMAGLMAEAPAGGQALDSFSFRCFCFA